MAAFNALEPPIQKAIAALVHKIHGKKAPAAAVQKAVAASDLKDVPAAIQQPEPALPTVATWKGKPLKDKPSDELVELRKWCVKTDPVKWATKVEEIDTELAGRVGE